MVYAYFFLALLNLFSHYFYSFSPRTTPPFYKHRGECFWLSHVPKVEGGGEGMGTRKIHHRVMFGVGVHWWGGEVSSPGARWGPAALSSLGIHTPTIAFSEYNGLVFGCSCVRVTPLCPTSSDPPHPRFHDDQNALSLLSVCRQTGP